MQKNLMDRDEVKTQLEALANKVASGDARAANRLRNLRVAVAGGNNADAWASANIEQLINPAQIAETYKNQKVADALTSFLEWARNFLIFVPLMLSWWTIYQAVSAYGDYIKKHQDQITQPFLYLWQSGFGNRLPVAYLLSSLAIFDAVLLALLVIITIAHSSLVDFRKQRRVKDAETLRADLADALAGAALCLTMRNRQQPTNVADAFDRSSRFFADAIEKLLKRVEELAKAQQSDHQAFANLSGDLRAIMGGVSTSVADLKISVDALRRSMGQLVTPVGQLVPTLATVSTSSLELVRLANNQINQMTALQTSLDTWGTNLQTTLGKLDTAVNAGKTLGDTIRQTNLKNEELHAVLTQELANQKILTGNIIQSTTNMNKIVGDLHKCFVELAGLSKEVDDLTRRLASLNKATVDLAGRVTGMAMARSGSGPQN